jgi:lipoate-protein ligase A
MRADNFCSSDPRINLDYDDELLRRAEIGGGETIRFWESPTYFIVLGRTCKEEDDVDLEAAHKDAVPVLRRCSGGGTVLQGPGCLNFSLILSKKARPELDSISASYRYILDRVMAALRGLGVDGAFRPICDLVVADFEQKFSGNAQRRGRHYILHHGTILYAFDLTLISRYLKIPPKMPEYRLLRPHAAFVTNIPVDPLEVRRKITENFT